MGEILQMLPPVEILEKMKRIIRPFLSLPHAVTGVKISVVCHTFGLPLRIGPTIVHNIRRNGNKKAEFNIKITCSEVLMVLYKHSCLKVQVKKSFVRTVQ